ncbi:hypothetical protein ACILD7_02330 [Capnocytophaga canimorsus]|uniref:hypothetical protein n=1 Tax=Capnocytophaga canimorsus TaxID=28188 RepID=UPI00249C758A|nr:hypothetical protein [Capnocytophaga canimorsus]WGU68218.1 hypothetical protein QIU19_13280 [Capnocytophaga canimorsus]WGU70678.1 hypothetical protein QIU18_00540 [Capnocytophaga canimorsus]
MMKIQVLNEDLTIVWEFKGEHIFVKIIDGIQCICKNISFGMIDDYRIVLTVPKNFFIKQTQEQE